MMPRPTTNIEHDLRQAEYRALLERDQWRARSLRSTCAALKGYRDALLSRGWYATARGPGDWPGFLFPTQERHDQELLDLERAIESAERQAAALELACRAYSAELHCLLVSGKPGVQGAQGAQGRC